MRVSRRISTGRIIETQSHGDDATMIANAVAAGIPRSDIDLSVMSDAEAVAELTAQVASDNALPERVAEKKNKARQDAAAWILSDDPHAVAMRGLFRGLLEIMPSNKKWPDLMAVALPKIAAEIDPSV